MHELSIGLQTCYVARQRFVSFVSTCSYYSVPGMRHQSVPPAWRRDMEIDKCRERCKSHATGVQLYDWGSCSVWNSMNERLKWVMLQRRAFTGCSRAIFVTSSMLRLQLTKTSNSQPLGLFFLLVIKSTLVIHELCAMAMSSLCLSVCLFVRLSPVNVLKSFTTRQHLTASGGFSCGLPHISFYPFVTGHQWCICAT